MKMIISRLMVLILVVTLFLSGCIKSDKNSVTDNNLEASTNDEKGYGLTEIGTYPIVKDKITLKVFMPQYPQIIDYNTNEFTKFMEEKTNIHLEFETALQDAVLEKLNLTMSSGDLPDVIMNAVTADAQTGIIEARYGVDEKLFIPLNNLIDSQMSEFKKVLSTTDGLKGAITATDGNIYGLPGWNDCFHCTYQQKMWINEYWLNKLGLKTPTTTEEFYQVLKTFKEKVPKGIPLTGSVDGWVTNPDTFITNAFILDTGMYNQMKTFIKDNKFDTSANKDEYKEALAFMNKLYKEDLLYPGSFTQKTDQLKQLIASPGEPVLCVAGGANVNWIDVNATPEVYKHYVTLAPLAGPKGVRQSTYFKYFSTYQMQYAITKDCKYPEAALRWADYFYTLEGQSNRNIGLQGRDWEYAKSGDLGLDGKPAKITSIRQYSHEPQNVCWQDTGIIYATKEFRLGNTTKQDVDLFSAEGLEKLLYIETAEKYEPYASKSEEVVPPLKLLTEETQDLQTITVELQKYITESRTRFIMGDLNLEKDWDKYVTSLNDIGLNKYILTYQKAYDRQYKK